MALPSSGAISLNQVNVELGLSGTAPISMGASNVRTLFGVASGAISMSNGYGKANAFNLTIASNTTNLNLRTAALAAGWNGTTKVIATINSGVYVYSTSTGSYALTINGSFPGGVELVNNGVIVGRGGAGGVGDNNPGAGSSGGPGLLVQSSVSINNASGRIAGGGGGGGGGGAGTFCVSPCKSGCCGYASYYAGGGGGGIGNGPGGNGGSAASGGSGTLTSAGSGGPGGGNGNPGGAGGAGGTYGSAGSKGANIYIFTGPNGGGAGAALAGNSLITWLATGTRNGAIT